MQNTHKKITYQANILSGHAAFPEPRLESLPSHARDLSADLTRLGTICREPIMPRLGIISCLTPLENRRGAARRSRSSTPKEKTTNMSILKQKSKIPWGANKNHAAIAAGVASNHTRIQYRRARPVPPATSDRNASTCHPLNSKKRQKIIRNNAE